MINLISSLDSFIKTVPSERQILKMVSSLSEDLKENHYIDLQKNGVYDMLHLDSSLKQLFLNVYVNRGFHGYGVDKNLHDFIRNEMTELHQVLLMLSDVYVNSRKISING